MKKFFKSPLFILASSIVASVTSSFYFMSQGLHLSNFDSMSRLNISRKIIDNLTPGFGQLGNVWPPLPQLLMLPFVAFEPLWHSGLAGTIVSSLAFIASAYLLYRIIKELTSSVFAQIIGVLLFITNINLLLLQSMAMSEVLFIFFMLSIMHSLLQWRKKITNLPHLFIAGMSSIGLTLVRYEGYAFALAAVLAVGIITWKTKRNRKTVEGFVVLFGTLALFGIILWMLYLWAIFGDPFYWAKIYSHTKSIISSDVDVAVKTFVDQSTKKAPRNIIKLASDYGLSIVYMAGIPLSLMGIVGSFWLLLKKRFWKDSSVFVLFLPLSVVAFMIFTMARGGIPVNVPQMSWEAVKTFSTNFADEYNIRYGILLFPSLIIMTAWLCTQHTVFKILAAIVLGINLVLPFWKGGFLMYQLPVKWATGSATSKAEDQATKWFKNNYDGGLIMISALKHDPTMFRLDIPYKNFIHEGTSSYWITSRQHPDTYATWIYMADIDNMRGGLGGEEDSVTKYLQSVPDLDFHFEQRYNDGVIAIYKKRSIPITDIGQLKNPEQSAWSIRSVDTMKISRDKARDWLNNGDPSKQDIVSFLHQIKSWNANYVAIDTPYDEEFYPYLKLWADLAHEAGLHVWYRGNWSAWEGWFEYPKSLTREEHLKKTYAFIINHPELFKDGDSFTPCPECENGGPGDPRKTGDIAGYNQFLVDLHTTSESAFEQINVSVATNWFSVNGDIARLVLDKNTVQQLGGLVTIDHYVSAERMKQDVLFLSDKLNANILIGEYGANGTNSNKINEGEYQKQQLEEVFTTLTKLNNKVVGVNYWVNIVGPTALLTNQKQEKPAAKALSDFYHQLVVVGKVVDDTNAPLEGVRVSLDDQVSFSDSDGSFNLSIFPQKYTLSFEKDGYVTEKLTLDFAKSSGRNHLVRLNPVEKNKKGILWFWK